MPIVVNLCYLDDIMNILRRRLPLHGPALRKVPLQVEQSHRRIKAKEDVLKFAASFLPPVVDSLAIENPFVVHQNSNSYSSLH